MADFDFNYTVGFTGDFGDIQKKIKVLTDGIKPIDLKAEFPNLDTGNAQKAIDEIGKSGTIKSLSLETKSFTDAMGNLHEEIVKVSGSYQTLQGHTVRFSQAIPNAITGLEKQSKTYEHMIKKADEWSTRAETMGQKDKTAIQGTSAALKENIAKWEVLKGEYGQASPEARKVQEEIDRLNKELDKNIAASKRSAVATQSWGDRMAAAIKQTVTYTLTIGMVRKAQQELNKAIQFAIQLNTEMTKIQVLQAEGAQTPEEINELAQSFNSLAKEMGTTTIAIAEGSVEWLRQGKTVQETQELLRASTMLSKLGALSAAEATEYLTSTLNSYGMAAEEAVSVVDKLVQVDNISATSTKELATALRYSAATAKEAGVELEQLVSYIAVVSSTTRQNAESIGQGMKTMFTRMQDIKAGAIDEDGLGLNNVESALARVNIALRDTPTSFRDMSAVLEDVAAKWSTLNDIEQANIAKAIAGVRQQNLFMVLMQNMGKALEYQNEQFNANGVALDRYGIYLDSIEAKQQTFKATMEGLYMDVNFQDMIKDLIDLGTHTLEFIDSIGGLKTALGLLTGAFVLSKGKVILDTIAKFANAKATVEVWKSVVSTTPALNLFNVSFVKGTASVWTFNAALQALNINPVVLGITAVTLALGGLAYGLYRAETAQKRHREELEKAEDSLIGQASAIKQQRDSMTSNIKLAKEYDSLREKELKTGRLNTEEAERLKNIQNDLAEIYPELSGTWDDQLNFQIDSKSISAAILEIENKKLEILREQNAEIAKGYIEKLGPVIEDKKEELEKLERTLSRGTRVTMGGSIMNPTVTETPLTKEEISEIQSKINELTKDIKTQENAIIGIWSRIPEELKQVFKADASFWSEYGELITASISAGASTNAREAGRKWIEEYLASFNIEDMKYSLYPEEIFNDLLPKIKEGAEAFSDILSEPNQIIPDSEIEKLKSFQIEIATAADGTKSFFYVSKDGTKKAIKSIDEYIDACINTAKETANISEESENAMRAMLEIAFAAEQGENALQSYESAFSALSSAYKEQADTGSLSLSTISSLIDAGYAEVLVYDAKTNSLRINESAMRQLIAAKMNDIGTSYSQRAATLLVTDALNDQIPVLQKAAQEWWNLADAMAKGTLDIPEFFGYSGGGGGGGSSGPSAEEQAINAEIKALEKKKKEIQKAAEKRIKALEKEKKAIEEARDAEVERLEEIIEGYEEEIDLLEKKKDAFNELIDKQKESLEIAKDADDFARDQAKKATELSTLRTQIANISLDTSEEGIARRLELEQEASELEEEIAEDSAERKYDLQIDALDRMAEAFEEATDRQIEAIELQIEAIEKQIEAVEDLAEAQIEAIEKQIEAIREETDALIEAIDEQIEALREQLDALRESGESSAKGISEGFGGVEKSIAELRKELAKYGIDLSKISDSEIKRLSKLTGAWGEVKHAIREAREEALKLLDYKQVLPGGLLGQYTDEPIPAEKHEGGIIESHHSGNFAGNLKSNEVFAKLLKGEYVATENQMDNFLKQVFPKLATHPDIRNISNSNQSVGDIHVNMPITVQGNMDSSVIPQIDQISKRVIDDINKALVARGHIRNSNITIS